LNHNGKPNDSVRQALSHLNCFPPASASFPPGLGRTRGQTFKLQPCPVTDSMMLRSAAHWLDSESLSHSAELSAGDSDVAAGGNSRAGTRNPCRGPIMGGWSGRVDFAQVWGSQDSEYSTPLYDSEWVTFKLPRHFEQWQINQQNADFEQNYRQDIQNAQDSHSSVIIFATINEDSKRKFMILGSRS
jgi:hypothetical protein